MTDPFVYYRVPTPASPNLGSAVWEQFLDLFGRNRMLAPLTLYPGKPNAPSWGFLEDERTGPFSDGVGRIGWTLGLQHRITMTAEGFELWDESGRLSTFVTGNDYFGTWDSVADAFAGAAVMAPQTSGSAPSGKLVQLASSGSGLALGLVIHGAETGDSVQVRTSGFVSLPDWTAVVGTVLLEDPEYYLDVDGTWTATSGTQWVASRVGPNTVRVRC